MKIQPSIINQLKTITKNFQDLEYHSYDVDGNDPTDAIFYSRLQDQINEKIKEIDDSVEIIQKNE